MELKDKLIKLRQSMKMNRKEFCEYFQIPYMTETEWELGKRRVPPYLLRLLEYKIRIDDIIKNSDVRVENFETNSRKVSIIEDIDGRKTVVIHDIRFKGKRNVKWKDVKEYLEMYVGDFYRIADTQDVIYIGKELPDEYTGSEYTYSLKGAQAKAKANAAQGIPELLEIAVGKHYRKNESVKHEKDAKYGWYRYDSRFAIPVYDVSGEVERYNVFHASMLIRHDRDNRLYLYDIIDIKKETSNPFRQ